MAEFRAKLAINSARPFSNSSQRLVLKAATERALGATMYDISPAYRANDTFYQSIAETIWQNKYRYLRGGQPVDLSASDTWSRVARALAQPEPAGQRAEVERSFHDAIADFRLIPAGRILSGAGTSRDVTLSNTFVMRTLPDSIEGFMDVVKEAAVTMKMGGGIGFDFSTIRPKGMPVRGLDCPAAGPVAAMDICDSVCRMVVTGMGRGAMMATLRCDHPDIEAFVMAKADPARLRNFNVSVLITDPFMEAVRDDASWALVWGGKVIRRVRARVLWDTIMRQNYEAAEPGVLFIDRINAGNPLGYVETIAATNSCAEQPLPPNGTCPLAAVNLARLVISPFTEGARMDEAELERLAAIAVRMLDNTIDVSQFAVSGQRDEARAKRRIGVGVTGVGDALIMMGARYGSPEAAALVERWLSRLANAAYLASARLAAERGSFPLYDAEAHAARAVLPRLDPEVQAAVARHGLRNGALTTIAPTGTISMLAGNVSSGIEPVFATSYRRRITQGDGTKAEEEVMDYAVWLHRRMFGAQRPLGEAFVTVADLRPEDHVAMQAAAQKWIDSGISKTVNCPEDIAFEDFQNVYLAAYDAGCKGCTTYRPNAVTGSILSA